MRSGINGKTARRPRTFTRELLFAARLGDDVDGGADALGARAIVAARVRVMPALGRARGALVRAGRRTRMGVRRADHIQPRRRKYQICPPVMASIRSKTIQKLKPASWSTCGEWPKFWPNTPVMKVMGR